jgi:hypothetical protein
VTTPDEFATDVNESLMGLALGVDETSAVVILMRNGDYYSRKVSDVTDAEVIFRLRELANEMEKGAHRRE